MRYKIKSPNGSAQFIRVLGLLRDRQIKIVLQNDLRRILVIDSLSDEIRNELLQLGATVAEDVQYVPDAASAP